jgi:hypothetical protein
MGLSLHLSWLAVDALAVGDPRRLRIRPTPPTDVERTFIGYLMKIERQEHLIGPSMSGRV